MGRARRFATIYAATCALVSLPLGAQPVQDNHATRPAIGDLGAAQSNVAEVARTTPRPTVGLALSGGGARGGAHIGVLLALRDLRVPIDYIAGTSMGSVIGGFYASGLDEERLQVIAQEADWDGLFDDAPSRDNRTFHRKRDDELFLVKQRAGLNKGAIGLPMGLVQGQDMDLFLARVMLPVSHVEHFDDLPIPFRAVAADMATGETVILERGSLARAIRASMSIPAAIAPVEVDGRLLGDGGVVQNLPVETVRDMGADIVIAVDLSMPLATRDELTSVVAITGQLVGFLMARGTAEQIAKLTADDVLITPQVGGVRSLDFERIQETYAAGYSATMAVADKLSPLALPPEAYAAHRADRPDPRIETPPRIDFVRLDNQSNVADNIVEARLESIPTGVPLDVDAAERAVAQVYGLELFEHVSYDVVEENARKGLEVSVEEQGWGPNYLQFGLESSSAGSDETMFGVSVSYLRTAMNRLGAEWRTTVELGDEPALSMRWHQPFGWNAMTFASAGLSRASSLFNIYDGSTRIGRVRQDEALLDVALGREFGNWGELRFGVLRGTSEPELETGDPAAIPLEDFDRGEAFTRFTVDTLDSIYFPTGGNFLRAQWVASKLDLDATSEFDQFTGDFLTARTFGRHALVFGVRYGSTTDGIAPPSSLFEMGGFWDLSGFAQDELSGQNVGGLLASYYRRIGNLGRRLPLYAGITLEKGNTWQTRDEISLDNSLNAGSLWLGADTPIGPLYVAYGRAEGDRDSFYIVIGNVVN
jgi:NTE family protein